MCIVVGTMSSAADQPARWFIGGTVVHGKFVPLPDLACGASPRWKSTPKQLSKEPAQGGTSEVIALAKYEGKTIFIFADRNGASDSDLYGVVVITGNIQPEIAKQLWRDSRGGDGCMK